METLELAIVFLLIFLLYLTVVRKKVKLTVFLFFTLLAFAGFIIANYEWILKISGVVR